MSHITVKRVGYCATCETLNGLKLCGRCFKVSYCGRQHQVADWPAHQKSCIMDVKSNGYASPSAASGDEIEASPRRRPAADGKDAVNTSQDERTFDKRPINLVKFPAPRNMALGLKHLSSFATRSLLDNYYCVLDGVLQDSLCDKILREVQELEMTGALMPGQLAGDNVVDRSIRSDKIMWYDGNEPPTNFECPNIKKLLDDYMDIIVKGMHLPGIHILRKTKAMITCYPGDGTAYMKHIDNPTTPYRQSDGRIVTCIMYLNKNWDVHTQGGLLRIFPSNAPNEYVDVAPKMNRMLLFWADGRNPHEVQPTYHKRYAVTLWYFDEKERKKACFSEHTQNCVNGHNTQDATAPQGVRLGKRNAGRKLADQSLSPEDLAALRITGP